jgi:hypothetical protein
MASKSPSLLSRTRGNTVVIDFGNGLKSTFTAGGRRRVLVEKVYDDRGVVYVNGKIRMADGTEAYAVLGIDETSSGEHCDTGIFLEGGRFVWQPGLPEACHKSENEVFPYRYFYSYGLVRCNDHHVGDDGWSVR